MTTHENFITMYDRVYAAMVDAKVATPLNKSEYQLFNRAASQAKIEEEATGHHIKYRLSNPQYVLFGDKLGTDTNHMEDGNNGGQSYISIKGTKTNLLLFKASGSFTLMGITDAIGETVLCICILAAKSLSVTDVKGFDYRASIPYESSKTTEETWERSRHFLGFQSTSSGGDLLQV